MELGEKLQKLRKQKGITQEQLADSLFVSRAAVSKWESGRGYPNIDSLKAIAQFFGVTIDELLREEALPESGKAETPHRGGALFAWLDIGAILFMLLPVFGQSTGSEVLSVSLISMHASLVRTLCMTVTGANIAWGIFALIMRAFSGAAQKKYVLPVSFLLGAGLLILFILARQPYASVIMLISLSVKGISAVKRR